ncbi:MULTISPECIES: phage head closure protein [unclassified Massilia]|uniref:phage head closure protein n=1 Tax=unclassified Massilia TaxID=2609279 RepID=UPI00177C229C|nr:MULTISPECIES: phage head closure protein [unclassified Massilia]MBD8531572.1 phage head closure protein [Massilia sp. CFBP 13647]MBD8673632.1 phage head closure protein [Massilia sp. CFBP 13721]
MRLNDRVIIRERVQGADSIGQPTAEWVDLGVFWADVRHLRGLETLRAGADVSVLRASVCMWHRPEITAAMQLVHGDTTYEIKSPPLRNADRRFMDLVCESIK